MIITQKLAKTLLSVIFLSVGLLCARAAYAEPVTEKQALEIAEFWHAAEVNYYYKKGWKRDFDNKDVLLYETPISRVRYLVGRDNVADRVKKNQVVLAYIIEFEPVGHVVISADDRFTPLLAFSIDSVFNFEDNEFDPGHNFMRMFLNRYAEHAAISLSAIASKNAVEKPLEAWSNLRSMVKAQQDLLPEEKSYVQATSSGGALVLSGTPDPNVDEVLLETAHWDQGGFYNDYFDELVLNHVPFNTMSWEGGGAPPAGFPDVVPTGCNATALAIILRYHEWPWVGQGLFSHFDVEDFVFAGGLVDFGVTSFQWTNMPTGNINDPADPDFGQNPTIAQLMYHTGMLVRSNWEDVPGTSGFSHPDEWNYHLRYKDTTFVEAFTDIFPPSGSCEYARFRDHDYFFCKDKKDWASAKAACSATDPTTALVDISDEEENDFLQEQMIEKGMGNAWIGATDTAIEGDWVWDRTGAVFWRGDETGFPLLDPSGVPYYESWPIWEPDDQNWDKDCAHIVELSGFWIAYSCNTPLYYICSRPVHSEWILNDIALSVIGGLPVFAGTPGHAIVIDGYRANDPNDEILSVNPGWGAGHGVGNTWYKINDIPGGPILINATVYQTPINYIYVDGAHSGVQNGSLKTPYSNLFTGILAMPFSDPETNPKGGRLWIKAGTYTGAGNTPITIPKAMEISSYRGDVNIGNKLYLKHSGTIRINSDAGSLTIQ